MSVVWCWNSVLFLAGETFSFLCSESRFCLFVCKCWIFSLCASSDNVSSSFVWLKPENLKRQNWVFWGATNTGSGELQPDSVQKKNDRKNN